MAPRRPSLTRFVFQAILVVMVMRFVFVVSRLLARRAGTGRRPLGSRGAGGPASPRATGKARPRVDRSGATDVSFTELPAPERQKVERG